MSHQATDSLPIGASGQRSLGWWGMLMLMATEATLFTYLLTTYFTLRFRAERWPPEGISYPELVVPGINTLILLASSVPMHWADGSIRRGHQGRLGLGLAISFLLGATFLGIQVWGASRWEFAPQTNAYASVFIITTVFHGAHLVVGLLMSAVVQTLAWLGYYNAHRHLGVQVTALYWHFVDAVWLVVFATIHVSPYLKLG